MALTINNLISSTISFSPKRAHPSTIEVISLSSGSFRSGGILKKIVQAIKRNRTVLYKYIVKSEEGNTADSQWTAGTDRTIKASSGHYRVFVYFTDVKTSSSKSDKTPVEVDDGIFSAKMSMGSDPVKVRCDCHDFRWRFAYYNKKNDSLYGAEPPPYKRVTNRPPVNPKKLPGMCKHLLNVVKHMKQNGVLG